MTDRFTPTKPVDPQRRAMVSDPTVLFQEHGGEVTEALVRFMAAFCTERSITTEECIFGLALACCNARADFPPELGGSAKFDEIAAMAQDYYDVNTRQT